MRVLSSELTHEIRDVNGRTCDVLFHELEPRLSFVVPIFNAARTLEWALGSLFAQYCDGGVEIICVDDDSTDGSREILDRFSRDERVTIVSHRSNAGYGASMNDGIACARGKWIGILEPDDYVLPDMASRLMGIARDHDCDVIKTPYIREIREEGALRGDAPKTHLQCNYHHRVRPATTVFTMSDPGAAHLLRHHPSIWSAFYRKAFLEDAGIKFQEYPRAGWADGEFGYEALLRGRICYVDEPFYVYREETPDEAALFQRNNRLLPIERWQSMLDVIEGLGIDDEHVLSAHVAKGFAYAKDQLAAHEGDAEVLTAVQDMFDRMDPTLVIKDPTLDVSLKKLYGEARDVRVGSNAKVLYLLSLAKELAEYVRANGPGDTLDRIKLLAEK